MYPSEETASMYIKIKSKEKTTYLNGPNTYLNIGSKQ